jgi:hypothetical protein
MIKHNKLGKVVDQIGGLRIREITIPGGKEYGLYAGKRLFKQMLNLDTLKVMAHKIKANQDRLNLGLKKGQKNHVGFYSQDLLKEYFAFMQKR